MDRRGRVRQAQAPRALAPAGPRRDRGCGRRLRRAEHRRARDRAGPAARSFFQFGAMTKGVTMSEVRGNGDTQLSDRSIADLLKQLSDQTATLVRQELDLAKAELTVKGKRAGVGAGMLGGAGMFGLYALGALTACVILLLSTAMTAWLAALIVAAIYGAIAGVLALAGKNKAQAGTPPVPEQTVDSAKEDVRWTKQRAKEGRS